MKISFATKQPKADALVVGVFANRVLSNTAAEIDKACKGALRRAMRAGRFTGARDQFLDVVAPAGLDVGRIVIAGLGKAG